MTNVLETKMAVTQQCVVGVFVIFPFFWSYIIFNYWVVIGDATLLNDQSVCFYSKVFNYWFKHRVGEIWTCCCWCYDTDDVSVLFLGLHPHPGQWVECVQTLYRVQGTPQPSENPVSTSGHLQLPTQESHRKQGKLIVTLTFLSVQMTIHLENMEVQKKRL